jgi:hypothetical protein
LPSNFGKSTDGSFVEVGRGATAVVVDVAGSSLVPFTITGAGFGANLWILERVGSIVWKGEVEKEEVLDLISRFSNLLIRFDNSSGSISNQGSVPKPGISPKSGISLKSAGGQPKEELPPNTEGSPKKTKDRTDEKKNLAKKWM